MTSEFMKQVDKYAGQLMCFILSLFYSRRQALPEQVKKVIIIKMLGLGSLVLMTPMIRGLKQKFNDIDIHLITLEGNEIIPKLYDMTSHIHPIRRNTLGNFLLDTLKIILLVRKSRPYVVIDAEFFSRYTAVLSSLLGGQYNIGFYNRDYYRGSLIDFHTYFNPYRHMTRNFFELVSPLSCSEYSPSLESPKIPDQAKVEMKKMLEAHRISPDKPIILMNPNVSDTTPEIDRSWPLENFMMVARHCQQRGFQIVFIGSPDQTARTERAASRCGNDALSLAGKTSIEQLLALMDKSFLLITNDSGPLHLAVSVNLPTFSFFGTESPIIYGYDHGQNRVFYSGMACSPCLSVFNYKRGKCEFDSKCLKEIHPDEVIGRFDEALSGLYEHYRNKKTRE